MLTVVFVEGFSHVAGDFARIFCDTAFLVPPFLGTLICTLKITGDPSWVARGPPKATHDKYLLLKYAVATTEADGHAS